MQVARLRPARAIVPTFSCSSIVSSRVCAARRAIECAAETGGDPRMQICLLRILTLPAMSGARTRGGHRGERLTAAEVRIISRILSVAREPRAAADSRFSIWGHAKTRPGIAVSTSSASSTAICISGIARSQLGALDEGRWVSETVGSVQSAAQHLRQIIKYVTPELADVDSVRPGHLDTDETSAAARIVSFFAKQKSKERTTDPCREG